MNIEQNIIHQTDFSDKKIKWVRNKEGQITGIADPNCPYCSGTGNDGMSECICVESWRESL